MDWVDGIMWLFDEVQVQCLLIILLEDCVFLKCCVYLILCYEQCVSFLLDLICCCDLDVNGCCMGFFCYWQGMVEYVYFGVYLDVGGGYGVGNQGKVVGGLEFLLFQIVLQYMYVEVFGVGVFLQVFKLVVYLDFYEVWWEMMFEIEVEFSVFEEFVICFNVWQVQVKVGFLEEVICCEIVLIIVWCIDCYVGGLCNKVFFVNVLLDMLEVQQKVWEVLYKWCSWEYVVVQQGELFLLMSVVEQVEWDCNVVLIGGED